MMGEASAARFCWSITTVILGRSERVISNCVARRVRGGWTDSGCWRTARILSAGLSILIGLTWESTTIRVCFIVLEPNSRGSYAT